MTIFIAPGHPFDGSHYLEEILLAGGLCFVRRTALTEALSSADPQADLIILPAGSDTNGVEAFLEAGGNVVALLPDAPLAAMASLTIAGHRTGQGRLRITAPICPGARGEPLWTLGPQTIYRSELAVDAANAATLAYLFEPGEPASESIGIYQCPAGEGTVTVFAYDVAMCIARLRQGFPERAGVLPPGEVVPRSTFLHEPIAPHDTAWRPTADLHATTLCDVVRNLLEARCPVPTLWHIPDGKPAVLVFTGDEDGAAQEMNEYEIADVEAFDAAMSLYVIPNDTSITRELVEDYASRGHEISVHPDLWPAKGQSVEEYLAKAEADVLLFRERYGQPVDTVRNHSGIWPGYLDLPELWERLGIGMDSSCLSSLLYQSPDDGPYIHVNSAIPLRFVREDGTLIDVYEQPPHVSDDLSYHPTVGYSQKLSVGQAEWIIERMLEDAARWFYSPFCVIIHPSNYAKFSDEQGRAFLRHARQLGIPIWTLGRWHDFWRARASWRLTAHNWDEATLSLTLGGKPIEALCLTLPAQNNGKSLAALSLNGAAVAFEQVERYRRRLVQAPLPDDASEVEVVAEYGS